MEIENIQFYLKEAENYAGKHHFNGDGSTFSLIPSSELPSKYNQLHKKLEQYSQSQLSQMPRNWSIIAFQISNKEYSNISKPQSLCLTNLDTLRRDRYLVPDLSPEDLAHFPLNTLGGAYFQYMCHGRFYEFDKNPMTPDSEIEWFMRLLRQTHDFYHLVAEIYHYGWDGGFIIYNDPQCFARDLLVLSEEVCIYAFIMGQARLKVVIPIIAEWANTLITHCSQWLKDAYPLCLEGQSYETVEEKFGLARFISDCEKFMYSATH